MSGRGRIPSLVGSDVDEVGVSGHGQWALLVAPSHGQDVGARLCADPQQVLVFHERVLAGDADAVVAVELVDRRPIGLRRKSDVIAMCSVNWDRTFASSRTYGFRKQTFLTGSKNRATGQGPEMDRTPTGTRTR